MFTIPKNSIALRIGKIFLLLIGYLIAISYIPTDYFGLALLATPFAIYYIFKFTKYSPKSTAEISPSDISIPTPQTIEISRAKVNNEGAITLFIIVLILNFFISGIGLGAGWEVFIFGPFVLIGVIIYITIFAKSFAKYNAANLTIYTTLVLAVFSFISLKLNYGIATDGSVPSYFFEFLFNVKSGHIPPNDRELFGFLLSSSMLFFVFASLFISQRLSVVGYITKKAAITIMLLSLVSPVIHVGYFLHQIPIIREAEKQEELEEKKDKAEQDLKFFTKTLEEVKQTTLIDRVYSFFTIEKQELSQDNDCNNVENYFLQLDASITLQCFRKFGLYGAEYFPYATTSQIGVRYPFDDLKKGDILALVVRMDPQSYARVHINGNNVLKDPLRMNPYMYEGIKESETIDGVQYYHKSVVQFSNRTDTKYIMILYPVNIDISVTDFNFNIGMFNGTSTGSVEVLELAKITPKSFIEPKWVKEWSAEPNPFLD